MFGESLKVLMCLSVLMSTCVSMHMVRDAFHRPIDQLPNPYGIIDRNDGGRSVVNKWIDQVDGHKKRPSNDYNGSKTSYKTLNLDFERLIEPTKNDHHNYNERAVGGGGIMPMIYAKNQKRKYQIATNRLIESKLIGGNSNGDVTNENHGSIYESLSHSSKPLIPKNMVSFRSGLLPRSSTATTSNDKFQWQKQAWKSEPVKEQEQQLQQKPSKQSPSTSSIKKIDHSLISIDTMNRQIKKLDTQSLQPQLQEKKLQQSSTDKSNQQHLTKRTSNTARINGDDIDVDGYHDFGSQEWKLDYGDQDHMDVMEDGVRQQVAQKGIPNNLISRGMRGQRQYDVPQIECPPAPDGMERFACPTPDRQGRYRCIDDHVLCDGFIDCPDGEDEERQACMFYKTTKAHLDVLADALLRWARGR